MLSSFVSFRLLKPAYITDTTTLKRVSHRLTAEVFVHRHLKWNHSINTKMIPIWAPDYRFMTTVNTMTNSPRHGSVLGQVVNLSRVQKILELSVNPAGVKTKRGNIRNIETTNRTFDSSITDQRWWIKLLAFYVSANRGYVRMCRAEARSNELYCCSWVDFSVICPCLTS